MAKRKKKPLTFSLGTLVLSVVFSWGVGLAVAHYLEPKGLTKEICAERIRKVGGPQYAIDYVCNGATFSISN